MEWIISGLIGLFFVWCGYCVADYQTSWCYYNQGFKRLKLISKLIYITYKFVKWTSTITIVGVLFILVTVGVKLIIFG